MNIVIHLEHVPASVETLISDLQQVLHNHGLASDCAEVGSIFAMSSRQIPVERDACGGCNQEVCACDPMFCSMCGQEPCKCEANEPATVDVAIPAEGMPEVPQHDDNTAPTEPEVIVPVDPDFGHVKVLTLSTHLPIPSKVNRGSNTTLQVTGRILTDGVVRFTYNGFEHALPVADANDRSICNQTHTCGSSTVRLVLDITNKTYACLVDVEGGDGEMLLIGDDLLSHLNQEPAANVPAEQH